MARCSSIRTTTTRYRTLDLPAGARRPTPTQPMAAVLAFPNGGADEVVEIDLDDVEIIDEDEDEEIEIEL
jgi:hypothetical protein